MIRKTTWIVLGLFVVLLAGALFWNWQQKKGGAAGEVTPTPTGASAPLFSFSGQALAGFRLEDSQGRVLEVWRDYTSNLWEIKEPAGGGTPDQDQIDSLTETITSLSSLVSLNPVTDFNPYGLGTPRYTLTLILTSGEENQVFIGDLTPTGNGYYTRMDTNAPLVVSKFSIDTITKLLEEPPYESTPTVPPTTPAITPSLETEIPQP